MKFKKLVAVDNIGFPVSEYEKLGDFAEEFIIHNDYPKDKETVISRIGDADCILVSWNTRIGRDILSACPNLRYVGMCCSLYDEKSANVDIAASRELGITVRGVRDYGDWGVVNFVVCELIELLQGFGSHQWKDEPMELTGIKVGIIGLGVTGSMVAQALKSLGAEVSYYDAQRKPSLEKEGITYMELDTLLKTCQIISTHLPKHIRILDDIKLSILGCGKIIINPSLGPTYELAAVKKWLSDKSNYLISEKSSMTEWLNELLPYDNFIYTDKVCGMTRQAKFRLCQKVMDNMHSYLNENRC